MSTGDPTIHELELKIRDLEKTVTDPDVGVLARLKAAEKTIAKLKDFQLTLWTAGLTIVTIIQVIFKFI